MGEYNPLERNYVYQYNNKLDVWVEDYENDKTIDLVERGELK